MTDTLPPDPAHFKEDVRNYLKFLQKAGFLYLTPNAKGEEAEWEGAGSPHARCEQLETLRSEVIQCCRCPLATQGRTHVVFGEGDPNADLMFVGEGPGADEDAQARPFVGRSGQLLTQMIQDVGLRREQVFIANIIKCRPPGNRDPLPNEIEACEPYLRQQIDLIQPRVIVALGRFAAHTLTGETTSITRMRGQFYQYQNVKLMPTLHPAAVLRNMNYLPEVVADIRRAVAAVHA
ncbi:MAG TPA: uracil-DNA glycosylase [Candidatus Sumerlaeota bacterium]|nr:uracil-DNA glycosylase [Candidatus Sumerlaeota bacterium]HPS02024.1 uracil-DNA glycosylase [Candidatus Sumerlaeota bacterium]